MPGQMLAHTKESTSFERWLRNRPLAWGFGFGIFVFAACAVIFTNLEIIAAGWLFILVCAVLLPSLVEKLSARVNLLDLHVGLCLPDAFDKLLEHRTTVRISPTSFRYDPEKMQVSFDVKGNVKKIGDELKDALEAHFANHTSKNARVSNVKLVKGNRCFKAFIAFDASQSAPTRW